MNNDLLTRAAAALKKVGQWTPSLTEIENCRALAAECEQAAQEPQPDTVRLAWLEARIVIATHDERGWTLDARLPGEDIAEFTAPTLSAAIDAARSSADGETGV